MKTAAMVYAVKKRAGQKKDGCLCFFLAKNGAAIRFLGCTHFFLAAPTFCPAATTFVLAAKSVSGCRQKTIGFLMFYVAIFTAFFVCIYEH